MATDLATGAEVVLSQGPLAAAVRAAMSLPGVFEPKQVDGRWLVDGGVANPLPVATARGLGADVAVAVLAPRPRVPAAPPSTPAPGIVTTMAHALLYAGTAFGETLGDGADVVVKPEMEPGPWSDLPAAPRAVEAGYRAGVAAAQRVLAAARLPSRGEARAGPLS